MATTIKLKNGSGAPLAGDLVQGEPALDLTNKRLYTEDSGGTVIEVGTNPSTIDINAGTIDGTVIGGSSAAAGTFTTFTSTGIDDNATSTAITIDASENVGIGTASPGAKFDVKGSARIERDGSSTLLQFTDTGVSSRWIGMVDGTSRFAIYGTNGSTEEFVIDSSGNVGIGTTSPSSVLTAVTSSNANNIQIRRNSTTTNDYAQLGFSISTGTTADNNAEIRAIRTNSPNAGDAEIAFLNRGSGAGPTERMRIDSSGNVGIGTSNPSANLEIASTTSIAGARLTTSVGSDSEIEFINTSSGNHTWAIGQDFSNSNAFSIAYSNAVGASLSSNSKVVIDSSGNVGIGTTPPAWLSTWSALQLAGDTGESGSVYSNAGGPSGALGLAHNWYWNGTSNIYLESAGAADYAQFSGIHWWRTAPSGTAGTTATLSERMRLDNSGNLLVGTTSSTLYSSTSETGTNITSQGGLYVAHDGTHIPNFNRITTDGDIIKFRKDGTVVGSIISRGGNGLVINSENSYDLGLAVNGTVLFYAAPLKFYPNTDNNADLGSATNRFDDVYATNGTIQTSDANEKQDIETLSEAEQRVAVAAKGLLRKFRWRSAVEEKGDDARIHFGIIAQDLQAAFEAEGLDAGRYAMFIHSTWTDEETGEERSRMGVRYSELLAFIIAAI